jgi:hypothetical protein
MAGMSQTDASLSPPKKLNPEFLLQLLNLAANCRLCDMDSPGAPSEVLFFGHGKKIAEMTHLEPRCVKSIRTVHNRYCTQFEKEPIASP